jgi:hypothetical protein
MIFGFSKNEVQTVVESEKKLWGAVKKIIFHIKKISNEKHKFDHKKYQITYPI